MYAIEDGTSHMGIWQQADLGADHGDNGNDDDDDGQPKKISVSIKYGWYS